LAAPACGALYTQNFESDTTGSWNVNKGQTGATPVDAATNFFFDYSTVGIPAAPSGSGTRGLKMQANLSSAAFGGVSVSPTGQNFGGQYRLTFDWWANYNGPLPAGGNGSTNLSTFGVGTAGTSAQWPGGAWDSVFFGATGDGGSGNDWRAYSTRTGGAAGAIWPETSGVYAAGNTAGVTNNSHAYYASFGANAAPLGQLTLFPQQSGVSAVGSAGMEWHQVEIEKTATEVTWTVDGKRIATIPLIAGVTIGGSNILFGHSDINSTSSSDANDVNLLFSLYDNVVVTAIPEPGAWLFCGIATVGAAVATIIRRRKNAASA
jgi:hypothetical protein